MIFTINGKNAYASHRIGGQSGVRRAGMHALTDIRRMPVFVETRCNKNCDLVNLLAVPLLWGLRFGRRSVLARWRHDLVDPHVGDEIAVVFHRVSCVEGKHR